MKGPGMLVGNFVLNPQKQESYSQCCLYTISIYKSTLLRLLNETVQLH